MMKETGYREYFVQDKVNLEKTYKTTSYQMAAKIYSMWKEEGFSPIIYVRDVGEWKLTDLPK